LKISEINVTVLLVLESLNEIQYLSKFIFHFENSFAKTKFRLLK